MNTDQYQRPAAERLHAATMGGHHFRPKPPGWTPPNQHATPDPDRPLAHLDETQFQVLVNGLLEDWDNPVYTELGLCRAHAIGLDQLVAVSQQPVFQSALATIRQIRAARRADIESAAATTALERLLSITQCNLDSAAAIKECRLAIKQILALLTPTPPPAPALQIAPNASEGMVPQNATSTDAPTSRARKEAAEPATKSNASEDPPHSQPTPTQFAPNASEGMVFQNSTPNPTHPTSSRGGAGDPSPASATHHTPHHPAPPIDPSPPPTQAPPPAE